jgi:pimeloyl-ACP methyl ester carboxylesterase
VSGSGSGRDDSLEQVVEYFDVSLFVQADKVKGSTGGHSMPAVPTVVYSHGNSGCRLDGLDLLPDLLPLGFALVLFDARGSGNADGAYVSLSARERIDVRTVLQWLRSERAPINVGRVCLWGRSMGAATVLAVGRQDPSVAALVCDSTFASLEALCYELVDQIVGVGLPRFMVTAGIKMVASSVKSRADYDIYELQPEEWAKTCYMPAFFGHGQDDDFIAPSHTQRVHDAYAGDKQLHFFPGDHNAPRPAEFREAAALFLLSTIAGSTSPSARSDHIFPDAAHDIDSPPSRSPYVSRVTDMPIRALKAELRALGVGYDDCVERHEVETRLTEARAAASSPPTVHPEK